MPAPPDGEWGFHRTAEPAACCKGSLSRSQVSIALRSIVSMRGSSASSSNRLRLSAEGKMYTCLFATEGTDLLTPLREGKNDQSLIDLISSVWNNRHDRYSELRSQIYQDNPPKHKVEMYQIGG